MIIQANALHIPAILWYNIDMTKNNGRFVKGEHRSPDTEFKKGEHWRPQKSYWNRGWLFNEYVTKQKPASEIARQFGITEAAIFHWLRKHEIPRRDMVEIRANKHWGLPGDKNGMYGKRGSEVPNWKGGCTPDRQAFYISEEWKNACSFVYKRDGAKCARCGSTGKLHVHHIVSFSVKEKRADVNNLVLLCVRCHRFVHSRKNINKEYIGGEVSG
jgi:hypothetical protein